jgi:hypothetical protein
MQQEEVHYYGQPVILTRWHSKRHSRHQRSTFRLFRYTHLLSINYKANEVKTYFSFGRDLMMNRVSTAFWVDFLPEALADG